MPQSCPRFCKARFWLCHCQSVDYSCTFMQFRSRFCRNFFWRWSAVLLYVMYPMFPAPCAKCNFSRAWHQMQVFPRLLVRLAPAACVLALSTGWMFSRAWHQVVLFPMLVNTCIFPAFSTRLLSALLFALLCTMWLTIASFDQTAVIRPTPNFVAYYLYLEPRIIKLRFS